MVDTEPGRLLVLAGLLLVAAGLLWPIVTGLGLGRLPGDVVVEREGFRFYFPMATMILLSLILYQCCSGSPGA